MGWGEASLKRGPGVAGYSANRAAAQRSQVLARWVVGESLRVGTWRRGRTDRRCRLGCKGLSIRRWADKMHSRGATHT